jgi:hypothetical protein
MSLKVIPTNIGGFNLSGAQLQGPLSSLFQNQNPQNLVYPSDLGSNPAMGHAVLFEVFDYTSGFIEGAQKLGNIISNATSGITIGDVQNDLVGASLKFTENVATKENAIEAAKIGLSAFTAPTYQKKTKGKPLVNISLYMPDTLNMTYNSTYTDVSLTDALGTKGLIGSAISDSLKAYEKGGWNSVQSILANEYGTALGTKIIGEKLGGSDVAGLLQQAAGLYINPQVQLLYKGVALRTFQLDFVFTPKSAQEAQITKDICDSFAFYSLPGLAGAGGGQAGQFLTPPQLFRIKFKFLGKNDILGSVSNVFSSALSNAGLGFLNTVNPTNTIVNGAEAKIMTLNDCVLENVIVDYAPNGWAAYNDGHPIQTTLTLQFKELEMPTKNSIKNSRVSSNYNNQQEAVLEKERVERVYAPRDSAYNDAGY